jgi:hypothetical protein
VGCRRRVRWEIGATSVGAGDDLSGVQCAPVGEVATVFAGGLLQSWGREVCGCGRRSCLELPILILLLLFFLG